MTAPLAAPPRSTTATPTRRSSTGTTRTRSAAVQRAYARRAQRTGAVHTGVHSGTDSVAEASRAPFVVLVMVLLSVTLVATLWLSTAAAGDSYRLQNARESARDLTERSEQLGREVATLETAPELARRALELGMVPAGDPARLVVGPDGAIAVVGEPEAATAPRAGSPAPVQQAPPAPAAVPSGA
ncbi:MAG: septum formation initiator [Pseudonocardiaceae bacterium]